ncbi:hypothetical protein F53441_10762 [Fusarium austroafricanum]|uniref:Uncharacterized protein n=1 Tax=Fusarium austroafricanum TaxID=2364996 RepID=A0A8H4KAM8_9HYPO|nr:hypothetical protein F53441_10762 [Fusarium austroafricanum]
MLHKPQSPLSILEAKLVAALEVTDMRYSLCCYGDFLDHIPRRLGHNEVLDASVDVMIGGLPYHYTREHSSEALAKYSRALKSLRSSLNRSNQQISPETLSAIYIIMICQGWLGRTDEYAQNHGKVLAQLASTAIKQNWGDTFGLQLLEALFVPLTLEAMVNPAITMQSWYPLLDPCFPRNSYNKDQHFPTLSLQARRLAQMPNFFHDPVRYLDEIKCAYRDLRDDHPRIQRYLEDLEYQPSPSSESDLNLKMKLKLIHKFQVVDAVLLTISIALNSILRREYPDDNVLLLEASTLANDMIALAQTVAQYRPFGASYIPPCLAAVVSHINTKSSSWDHLTRAVGNDKRFNNPAKRHWGTDSMLSVRLCTYQVDGSGDLVQVIT